MSRQYCKTCSRESCFNVDKENVGGLGYMIVTCTVCESSEYHCSECPAQLSAKNHDHRPIKNHMRVKHGRVVPVQEVITQPAMNAEEDTCPVLSPRGELSDDEDSDDNYADYDHTNTVVDDCQSSHFLDLDFDDANAMLADSFSHSNLSLDGTNYPDFGNDTSNTYFKQEFDMFHHENELFGGIRGICWRSRYRVDLHDIDNIAGMDDTKLMFNIINLLLKTPESANKLLYEVLSDVTNRMADDFDSANPHIRLPRNENDAVRTCLEGHFGIFNNLPSPNVHNIGGHACMKIGDVIAQHLAHGRGFEFTEEPPLSSNGQPKRLFTGIHGCQAMIDLINTMKDVASTQDEVFYGWFTTWSDSFLRSYVKQKLNNVWMYTITLPDPNHNATSSFHTYCVAVGAGALDHTSVIDWYATEIDELMRGKDYYCGLRKAFIHAKLGVVAALADRPEKTFTTKTALLGSYGKIASWACDIVPEVLPDCKKCFDRRLTALLQDRHSKSNIPNCSYCCQWDLNSNSRSVKRSIVPDKYPTESDPDSPEVPEGREMGATHVPPVKQTFEWLSKAVLLAAHNVTVGAWNKGVMDSYLRTCAIARSVRENLWKRCGPNAGNDMTDNNVVVDDDGEIDNYGEINDGYDIMVGEDSNVLPAIWSSSVLMSAYLDCGMHLVFHGIVSYCVEKIDEFLADHGLTKKFVRIANIYLLDIQALRLDWCKMKYFPKKQWLAENELALARIIPFVYGLLFLNLKLPDRTNTSNNTEHAIMQMFHTMHVMICVLMSPRDPSAEEVDEHVKMFLSSCHRYSRSYYSSDIKPFWANTGNFPTLLCLAEQRRRHGPIRWYWEGTSERFIQKLKVVLKSMRKTTQYFTGKLTLMHKTNVMDWLSEQFEKEQAAAERSGESKKRTPRMYYQYKTLEDIERKISQGEVLSGFTFCGNCDKIIVAYGERRRSGYMNCIGVTRLNKGSSFKCVGLAYVKCKLDDACDILLDVEVKTIENRIEHYCLMLPLIQDGDFDQDYAIIYDDWDVSDENWVKCLPNLCPLCFEVDVLC